MKMFTRRAKPIRITGVRISEVQLYFILALGHTSLPFNGYCGLFVYGTAFGDRSNADVWI